MNLSLRLKTIAGMVRFPTLADVGTDHAFLPIELCRKNLVKKAAACDVNKGPLEHARINISQYGLNQYIETRLGSGLESLRPFEFETLVIAGMGGALIEKLLSEHLETAKSFKQIILQPQRNLYDLRFFLIGNGFKLIDEKIIFDNDVHYFIFEVIAGESMPYTIEQLYFGAYAQDMPKNAFLSYLSEEIRRLEKHEFVKLKSETQNYLALCKDIVYKTLDSGVLRVYN